VREIAAADAKSGLRLRVSVDAGGCSGFQYQFELDDELDVEDDTIFEKDGVEVVTDTVSLSFLEVLLA
jgi:iron-sulfur cluster assembly accessory protein